MSPREKSLTEIVVIRMEPLLRRELEKLAKADHRSLSEYIRVQLHRLVADLTGVRVPVNRKIKRSRS